VGSRSFPSEGQRTAKAELSQSAPLALKLLVAGGFGVGKTTLVGAVSEIPPLRTEELLTAAGVGTDSLDGIENKTTTTVALDFGRITFPEAGLITYLFGTPGQERFWFMWNDLCIGALGAIVLVDTRRLRDSFGAIDFFEHRGIPYVVAVNLFDSAPVYPLPAVRTALSVADEIPLIQCDARSRTSARDVLITLVEYLLARRRAGVLPESSLTRSSP